MKRINKKQFIRRCFDLARLGKSGTKTNPMVGAVISKNDVIVAEDYHKNFGGPHAEVLAIRQMRDQILSDFIIYVSLEPCVHHGKTPPCTDLLIEKRIKECVVSTRDINPQVCGRGLQKLKEAGTIVYQNILATEGKELLRPFTTQQRRSRPFITLKWAQSTDGFLGRKGMRTKISNALSDRLVHKWRAEQDAILVGTNTVLIDDPSLDNRLYYGKSPIKVCIDIRGRIPPEAKIFNPPSPTYYFSPRRHPNTELVTNIDLTDTSLGSIFRELYKRDIGSVLVEGGTRILQSCLQEGLWDECYVITSPKKLGSGIAAPLIPQFPTQTISMREDRIYQYIRKSD